MNNAVYNNTVYNNTVHRAKLVMSEPEFRKLVHENFGLDHPLNLHEAQEKIWLDYLREAEAEDVGKPEDTRIRNAVNRGVSFLDILRQSAGFKSVAEAEEYLAHVAKKRDAFLKGARGLHDISPGLLHPDANSHLRFPAKDFLAYGESSSEQFSPIIRRSDRGFLDRAFNLEQEGLIWKHGDKGTEEEVALHPFNLIDQVDGDSDKANSVAEILEPFPHGLDSATHAELRVGYPSGVYEQMRFVEFQRAVAGLKRAVLRHINQRDAEKPVAQRAETASQIVREILEKSRKVYEDTNGTAVDKDDAVFNMLRQDYKDVLPHNKATTVITGFPHHVVSAVRAYATLPARARGDEGLYNQLPSTQEKPTLNPGELKYFIDALDRIDGAIPPSENRRVDDSQADLIDATAYNAHPASVDTDRPVHAAEGAGETPKKVDRNGNLSPHGRKRYLFRNAEGKVEGYGTQYSDVRFDPDVQMYVAYPTIVNGKLMSSDDAFAHYQKTGEFFHRTVDEAEARRAATEAHDESAEENLAWWNNYIADNLGKGVLAPELEAASKDEGFMRWARGEEPDNPMKRVVRQDAKGGAAGTETAEAVPQGEPAPQGGPRIVINPTTFKNSKDALCVAFNEGFRLWMEANDFQPQSEPTDAQRKFFSDTAYADDELQLRRTILARIATFDTSVKDPTDDQLSETAEFLNAVRAKLENLELWKALV